MDSTRRTCIKCKIEKDTSDFPDVKLPHRLKRCNTCRDCKHLYHQRYNKKKNKVRYNELETARRIRYKVEAVRLMGNRCQDCGQTYPLSVYDFHHLNPKEKDIAPALAFMRSWEKVEEEVIKKCILLCANCHRIRHHEK